MSSKGKAPGLSDLLSSISSGQGASCTGPKKKTPKSSLRLNLTQHVQRMIETQHVRVGGEGSTPRKTRLFDKKVPAIKVKRLSNISDRISLSPLNSPRGVRRSRMRTCTTPRPLIMAPRPVIDIASISNQGNNTDESAPAVSDKAAINSTGSNLSGKRSFRTDMLRSSSQDGSKQTVCALSNAADHNQDPNSQFNQENTKDFSRRKLSSQARDVLALKTNLLKTNSLTPLAKTEQNLQLEADAEQESRSTFAYLSAGNLEKLSVGDPASRVTTLLLEKCELSPVTPCRSFPPPALAVQKSASAPAVSVSEQTAAVQTKKMGAPSHHSVSVTNLRSLSLLDTDKDK